MDSLRKLVAGVTRRYAIHTKSFMTWKSRFHRSNTDGNGFRRFLSAIGPICTDKPLADPCRELRIRAFLFVDFIWCGC